MIYLAILVVNLLTIACLGAQAYYWRRMRRVSASIREYALRPYRQAADPSDSLPGWRLVWKSEIREDLSC